MQTIKSDSVGKGFATADSIRAIKRAVDTAKRNKATQTVICDGKPIPTLSDVDFDLLDELLN